MISPVGLVAYPDLFVRCGPLADEATECDDPILIVEVLSPATRGVDLVRKRWGYQAIPSLRQLIYVDASKCQAEIVTRTEDRKLAQRVRREWRGGDAAYSPSRPNYLLPTSMPAPGWPSRPLASTVLGRHLSAACPALRSPPSLTDRTLSPVAEAAARRRTFAIISHPDAGKTTLTEKLLLMGGAIHLAGEVKAKGERRRARSDWMKIEQQRGISVTTSVMTFEYGGCTFNLLGHAGP